MRPGRDSADELIVQISIQRLRHLAMLGRKGRLGVQVCGCLKLARIHHVGLGPHLVERMFQE